MNKFNSPGQTNATSLRHALSQEIGPTFTPTKRTSTPAKPIAQAVANAFGRFIFPHRV